MRYGTKSGNDNPDNFRVGRDQQPWPVVVSVKDKGDFFFLSPLPRYGQDSIIPFLKVIKSGLRNNLTLWTFIGLKIYG